MTATPPWKPAARGGATSPGRTSHGGRRGADQAGGEVDRRAAPRQSGRRPGQAGRRGLAALRPVAARRRLPVPPPCRAGAEEVTDAQARRVQAQFGASAAAYVASPLHAAGEDLDRLVAWGAARRPERVL